MFRYVVFVWNDGDPGASRIAGTLTTQFAQQNVGWRRVFCSVGVDTYCAGELSGRNEAHRFAGGHGVILGTLFTRDPAGVSIAAPASIAPVQSAAIVASAGQTLIRSYWGRYVAVWRDPQSGAINVLRDPSAALPCYTLRIGPADIYCSRIEDVLALCREPLKPDWSYIMACLTLLREHSGHTGLKGVGQVVGGECVRHCGGTTVRRYAWDPLAIAAQQVLEDPETAVGALGSCVCDVVRAWGARIGRALLSLSGGLDSSILLAVLAPVRGSSLICFHYYPREGDLDERRFARLAATRAGARLIERPRSCGVDLRALFSVAVTAEPTNYSYYLEHSRREAELAAQCAASSVIIGYGGDQLFYQERAEWAPGDFIHRHGLRPPVFRVLLDSARMDQLSLWRVLGTSLRGMLGSQRWSPLLEAGRERALLADGVVTAAAREQYCLHPLLRSPGELPSGKLWHAHQVLAPFDFYDPLGIPGDPEKLAPLLSQPLIELCLRIPIDVLTAGGWDRALARRAFRDELPAEIRSRRDKGGIESHMRLTVERNRTLLRELLLDGMLVKAGLLARGRLEKAFAGGAEIKTQPGELIEYACTEAWLERWQSRDSSPRPALWQTVA